jgi:hypothetical protein
VRSYEKDEERRWMTEIVAENFQLLDRFPDIKSEFEKQEAETA